MQQNQRTGDLERVAEDFTVKLLQEKGYKILERNFKSRFGEIDIIAEELKILVFVELNLNN